MKQLYYILTLSMLSTALFGQSMHILRYTDHAFQKGDTLIKQQVEYKVPGNKGSGQFWDFQTLKPINEAYKLTYSRISDVDTSQMCGLEHHTRYYYRQQNSTLQATGFENATTYMRYVQPELRIRYPMAYGDTLYSTFAGIGQYCHRIPLRVNGYTQVQVDGEGDLLLPEMPVIKKVLRVYTHRRYTETGKDRVEMNYDIYSWYAAGSRYPVFESVKTAILKTGQSDTTVFATSFFYPPDKQPRQTVDSVKLAFAREARDITRVFTEARYQPNPVIDHLNIDYKLTRNAKVWFSVHNSSGVLQRLSSPQNMPEGYQNTTIDMNGLISGVCLLYVHVDDMVLKVSVIKI